MKVERQIGLDPESIGEKRAKKIWRGAMTPRQLLIVLEGQGASPWHAGDNRTRAHSDDPRQADCMEEHGVAGEPVFSWIGHDGRMGPVGPGS